MTFINIDFISDQRKIFDILSKSKENGTSVGINCDQLGKGTYITAVEDIIMETDIIIVLKPYDAGGRMLDTTRLKLAEIGSVFAFSSKFENSYVKSFENKKITLP
jgi:hypothetical protein